MTSEAHSPNPHSSSSYEWIPQTFLQLLTLLLLIFQNPHFLWWGWIQNRSKLDPTSIPEQEGFWNLTKEIDHLLLWGAGPTDVRRHPRVVKASIRGNACVIPHHTLQFWHKYNTIQIQNTYNTNTIQIQHKYNNLAHIYNTNIQYIYNTNLIHSTSQATISRPMIACFPATTHKWPQPAFIAEKLCFYFCKFVCLVFVAFQVSK